MNMILYSRNDCPLCEDVEDILNQLGIKFRFIDIDSDDSLRKKYHVKVPVLVNKNQELCFPFTPAEIIKLSQL